MGPTAARNNPICLPAFSEGGVDKRTKLIHVAEDVYEKMTEACKRHGKSSGQVYLRPYGAAIVKIVTELLGESLGHPGDVAEARRAVTWRKGAEKLGARGLTIRPVILGTKTDAEFYQNMIEPSVAGQARLGQYLSTIQAREQPAAMDICASYSACPTEARSGPR
jgi:hypothetical protein